MRCALQARSLYHLQTAVANLYDIYAEGDRCVLCAAVLSSVHTHLELLVEKAMIHSGKRPRLRFGLRTLLCVPLVVAVLWSWTTWPERTADRFVRALSEGDMQAAQSMISTANHRNPSSAVPEELSRASQQGVVRLKATQIRPRSFLDWTVGRGSFDVHGEAANAWIYYGRFDARYGQVEPAVQPNPLSLVIAYQTPGRNAAAVFDTAKQEFRPKSPVRLVPSAGSGILVLVASREDHDQFRKLLQRVKQDAAVASDLQDLSASTSSSEQATASDP